jgi:hypothetical protein
MQKPGQHLIYHQGEWLDWGDCDQEGVTASHKKLNVLVEGDNEEQSTQNVYRSILSAITGDSIEAYNEACKTYIQARRQGLRRLTFMQHVLPLDVSNYPVGWRVTAPQAFSKEPTKQSKKILVCFTGQTGMMDMPIPCFHSVAHHVFDTIVYIYDPERNRYIERLGDVKTAIEKLCTKLESEQIYFAGVSDGGAAALWMHLQSPHSKGVLATSPTIRTHQGLIELLADASKEHWSAARIFFATGNAIDRENHRLVNSRLDFETQTNQIFNLNWASQAHASLGTLTSLGCLGNQLLWLRSQNRKTTLKFEF